MGKILVLEDIYKAKEESTGEWIVGNLQIELGDALDNSNDNVSDIEILTDAYHSYPIDYMTCCENAGFVDSDGKLVFDGDIVTFETPHKTVTAVIKKMRGAKDLENLVIGISRDKTYSRKNMSSIKVIGNIYDKWAD